MCLNYAVVFVIYAWAFGGHASVPETKTIDSHFICPGEEEE